MTDLELVVAAWERQQRQYTPLYAYHDGTQPAPFLTARLREMFRGVEPLFAENWCSVVVRAVLHRLHLMRLGAKANTDAKVLADVWDEQLGDLLADDVHESVLVAGEGYVVAWRDGDGIQVAQHDPRTATVVYEMDAPRRKRLGAKWWPAEDGTWRLVLYYADRLEYYWTVKKNGELTARAFEPWKPTEPNPYGTVPVFRFRASRRAGQGELGNAIPIQNAINKLAADMMVAAEYGAFRQRWVISQIDPQGALKNAPNEIWALPAGDGAGQATQVGEFSATDLTNYLAAIDSLANALAAITGIPTHYFFRTGQPPSGESLLVSEAPLVAKVARYQRALTPEWQALGAFILRLATGRVVPLTDVLPQYAEAATPLPRMEAEILESRVRAGIPLPSALAMAGWSQAEIEAMLAERAAEMRRREDALGEALLAADRRRSAMRGWEDE